MIHRCHLYIQLERFPEAQLDFEQAKISTCIVVQGALDVIEIILQKERGENVSHQAVEKNLTPTWKHRFKSILSKEKAPAPLGKLEDQLIQFISETPKDKFQIISHLYSDSQIEFETLLDRFKQTLSRIRKKKPGLIIFDSGKYRLSDETFLKEEAQ